MNRDRTPGNAVAVQNLQVVECLGNALAAETVQGPKEDEVELLEACILEELLERCPVWFRAAHAVCVLNVFPAFALAKFRHSSKRVRPSFCQKAEMIALSFAVVGLGWQAELEPK